MPTLFPGAVDDFANPAPNHSQNTAPRSHSQYHTDTNDAIEAIETYLLGLGLAGTGFMPVTVIAGTTFTAVRANHRHLLRADSNSVTTITIGANPSADWSVAILDAPYFSVVQRGLGMVNIAAAAGVTILAPLGYKASTRGQGSVITLTGDKVATGGWVVSGDMAPL